MQGDHADSPSRQRPRRQMAPAPALDAPGEPPGASGWARVRAPAGGRRAHACAQAGPLAGAHGPVRARARPGGGTGERAVVGWGTLPSRA